MKRGKVCAIHEEFSPDGECRWCEPPPSVALTAMPPLPILNCAHDGVLFDFNGITSCAACGKILVPAIPLVLHYAGCGSLVGVACTCGHP